MSARQPAPLATDAVATLALCGYNLAVVIGFARVFNGWVFFGDLATIVIVGHGLSFLLRRARVSGWIAIPLLAAVLAWLLAVTHYRDTMTSPIPWSGTWDRVTFDLTLVRDEFPTAIAPVLYDVVGWAMLSSIAIALVVILSDSFAFRAEARGESLVPGGVLFVFVAALGSPRLQVTSTTLLIASGVLAVIALRRLHDRDRGAVLHSRRRSVAALPLVAGGAVAIALIAGVIGPRLPGAHAEALYDTTGGGGTNFVDNPIVDIRSRLTNQGNVSLFQVDAPQPRYWRAATLAEYTGERFRIPSQPLTPVPNVNSDEAFDSSERAVMRQQVQILAPGAELVPAAADAATASGEAADGTALELQRPVGTHDLTVPEPLEPGDLVVVESFLPTTDPDELRAAGSGNVPDPKYLELPDGVPDVVEQQTELLTSGLPTSYDQAMALQDWFRDPDEFRYSTEIQAGHGSDALVSFFRVRAGYCEQFAGAFAVMARQAGIPSRVAVGYTQGTLVDGWYRVIGKNSHAWPELWFEGIGWVPFEPTPGRGQPGAESHTGVPPEQDTSGPTAAGGEGGDTPETAPTTPETLPVSDEDALDRGTIAPAGPELDDPGSGLVPLLDSDDGAGTSPPTADDNSIAWWPILISLLVVAALAAPAVVRRVRRVVRRKGDQHERVVAAWARAKSAARSAGVGGSPAMTATEWSIATAAAVPVAGRPMRSLADVVDRVTFAPEGEVDLDRRGSLGDRLSDDCELWAGQIDRIVVDSLPTSARLKRYFTDLG